MTNEITLKTIPNDTENFIIELEESNNNCYILAQKVDGSKHILHKNINYDLAIKTVSRYIIKFKQNNIKKV